MRIGSLFSGYGGLDMAVLAFYGGSLAWYAEVEPAACKVLAAHHPEVPNLGDVTRIDWTQVEPVDAITAGYPCQPFSHAGKRKGKNDERHLWPYVADAIGALGPSHVVLENVAGHLSMGLADVVGDLAGLGYDARWGVVRASDAGAPHQRARVFIVANPNRAGWRQHGGTVADESEHSAAERAGDAYADAIGERYDRLGTGTPAKGPVSGRPDAEGFACAPADSGGQRHGSGQGPRVVGRLGCAPEGIRRTAGTAWQEPGAGSPEDAADAESDERRVGNRDSQPAADADSAGSEAGVDARRHGAWLRVECVGLTAPAADADGHGHGGELHARGMAGVEGQAAGGAPERKWARGVADAGGDLAAADASGATRGGRQQPALSPDLQGQVDAFKSGEPHSPGDRPDDDGAATQWGKYAPAIRRWERVLGRPAPSPTVPGANGRPRLSPLFVEWMMGLPEGHVTGHGLSTAACLKMLGNGVVPQQAALALTVLLSEQVGA